MKFYKGKFKPKYPDKYAGDSSNIIYRSSWELKLFKYLDENVNVLSWASEEHAITYLSPIDNRYHRYFPDVIAKVVKRDGTTRILMIEVKPKNQTKEPEPQARKTRKYISEVTGWAVNQAKWKAAEKFCQEREWEFQILTENELGIK